MAFPPRFYVHDCMYEITFRAEENFPFPPTPLVVTLLSSIFAQALRRYEVKLSHFVVMSNHVHLHLVSQNPEHIPAFVGYIKRESAHYINRLLGRRKRTVWEEAYNYSIILDSNKAKERIAYFYCNPARANLVDCIEEYPHLHTWSCVENNAPLQIGALKLKRSMIKPLDKTELSLAEQYEIIEKLSKKAIEIEPVSIDPNCWTKCFPDTENQMHTDVNADIKALVETQEASIRRERKTDPIGKDALREMSINSPHQPKKFGVKVICLCSCKETLVRYMDFVRELFKKAKLVTRQRSLAQQNEQSVPPGMFMPGGKMQANLCPWILKNAFL